MELIPYKTKPTGFSGDSEISLNMVKEGIFLSFYRNNRTLNSMTLRILDEKILILNSKMNFLPLSC
jgi:hypothetical protein